jgi:hypothetical protein
MVVGFTTSSAISAYHRTIREVKNCYFFLNKIVNKKLGLRMIHGAFYKISVISWWSVLLMKGTGVLGENH